MIQNPEKFEVNVTNFLLEVKGLSVYLMQEAGEKQILDRVSFQIKRGKFTALMGRSGIGKTILLKAILGFLKPPKWRLEGDIIFRKKSLDGDEIGFGQKYILKDGEYNDKVISQLRGKNIATIFQGPDSHLHPYLKVKWQLEEAINQQRTLRKTSAKVNSRLSDVKINPKESRKYPHQFSQGQRQRILMAMALGHPDLIIADEPTSALDEIVKKQIVALLTELRVKKKIDSLFFITHDFRWAKTLLEDEDEIIILDVKETGKVSVVESVKLKDINSPWMIFDDMPLWLPRNPHPLLTDQDFNWLKRQRAPGITSERLILRIKDLEQSYRQGLLGKTTTILQGINLELKEGECLGIVGQSGCGKTTLVKSIARLLPNTLGAICYYIYSKENTRKEFDLIKLQPDGSKPDSPLMRKLRTHIQVIFQDCASIFNPRMTIYELFSETLFKILGIYDPYRRNVIIKQSLMQLGICRNEVEIKDIVHKYPEEFSGGEKQRLAIARVFLLNPRLIIADEPFADQDKITKEEIVKMIEKMRQARGTSFILFSHDLSLVKHVCDRVAVIENGRITKIYSRKS